MISRYFKTTNNYHEMHIHEKEAWWKLANCDVDRCNPGLHHARDYIKHRNISKHHTHNLPYHLWNLWQRMLHLKIQTTCGKSVHTNGNPWSFETCLATRGKNMLHGVKSHFGPSPSGSGRWPEQIPSEQIQHSQKSNLGRFWALHLSNS